MQTKVLNMPAAAPLVTAEQLERLPRVNSRYELVEGRLRRMSPPGAFHSSVAATFATLLVNHIKPRDLGKVFVELGCKLASNPDTVRGPDVAFVSRARIPASGIPRTGYWQGAPDLAVEILSPDNAVAEIQRKIAEYFGAGGLAVLVINPETETVTVHRPRAVPLILSSRSTLDLDPVVSGFTCTVRRIFE